MKQILVVVCVLLTFLTVSMMGGCASQEGAKNFGPLTGNEGAAKASIDTGTYPVAAFSISGNEGAAHKAIDMGTFPAPGFSIGGSEGAAKPGIKH